MKSFSALLCCMVFVYPCKASVLGLLDLNNIKDTVSKTVEGLPVVGGIASGALNTAGGLTGVAGKRGEFPFLGGPGKREALDEEDKRALFDLVQGLTDTVGQTLEGVPVLGGLASGVVKTAGGLGSATGSGSGLVKRALLDLAQGLKESVGQTLEGVPVVGGLVSGVVKTAGGLGGATGTGSGLVKRDLTEKVVITSELWHSDFLGGTTSQVLRTTLAWTNSTELDLTMMQ